MRVDFEVEQFTVVSLSYTRVPIADLKKLKQRILTGVSKLNSIWNSLIENKILM